MTIQVSQGTNPLDVDVVITETTADAETVTTSFTKPKADYLADLNAEKDWINNDITEKQAIITACNVRLSELDTAITAIEAL